MKYIRKYNESIDIAKKKDLADLFLELKDDYGFNYHLVCVKKASRPTEKTLPNVYTKEGNNYNAVFYYRDTIDYDAFILSIDRDDENSISVETICNLLELKIDILDSMGLKIQNLYVSLSGNPARFNEDEKNLMVKQLKIFLITEK